MFEHSFIKRDKLAVLKFIIFFIAFIIHVFIVAVLLFVPILKINNLPEITIYNTFLTPPPPSPSPPPPPPPPPPLGKNDGKIRSKKIQPVRMKLLPQPGRLIAPVEIPEEISELELEEIGTPEGVAGGVVGGVKGESEEG